MLHIVGVIGAVIMYVLLWLAVVYVLTSAHVAHRRGHQGCNFVRPVVAGCCVCFDFSKVSSGLKWKQHFLTLPTPTRVSFPNYFSSREVELSVTFGHTQSRSSAAVPSTSTCKQGNM